MTLERTHAAKGNGAAVTMRDVARAVGVSATAISKALNHKPDISEELRRRIFAVCDKLGYRLNSSIQDLARRGRGGLTRNVAFVLMGKAFADPAYSRAIDGVSRAAEKHRLHLILDRMRGDEATLFELPPVLRDGRVDGILVTGDLTETAMATLEKLGIPCVTLGSYSHRITGRSINVRLDLDQRLGQLVNQLVKSGRRRIAYFTERPDNYYEQESIAAFKAAVSENGLEADGLIYIGAGAFSGALPVMKPIFAKSRLPFDALVCLDFRTAQEISHLVYSHAEASGKPTVMMAVCRPFDYYRLPVPAIYTDTSLDLVAYEGVNALMDWVGGKTDRLPKQIVLGSEIEGGTGNRDKESIR